MSLKRQLSSQYGQVRRFFLSLTLPAWMTGSMMRIALLLVLIFGSTAYILKIGSSVALGYQIKAAETTIAELTAEQQKMAGEVASYRSMASIEARLGELKMVPVTTIDHVTARGMVDLAVAKK